MASAIDSWDRNARDAGDLSHALPVWWAHSLKDLLPHSGAVGRFHGRRLCPLVDGSNREDNFPDAGGNERLDISITHMYPNKTRHILALQVPAQIFIPLTIK
jgi:hypothetical protein